MEEENIKKISRLERDKNLLLLENKTLKEKLELEKSKNEFLIKREKVLQTVESYLIGRIKVLKKISNKEFEFATIELEKLSNALEEERQMIYKKEEDK